MLLNEYMRSLPITPQLNFKTTQGNGNALSNLNSSNNSLGIYFLNQLIKTNSFLNKRQLDLSSWLLDQIKQCVEPIHPVMVSLINNYVIQLFNLNILNENRLTPLCPKLILKFFQENHSNYDSFITPKLLLIYYLLVYETKRRETLISTLNTLQNPNIASNNAVAVAAAMSSSSKHASSSLDSLLTFRYSPEIFEYIPINYFLLKAKETHFSIVYPPLLRFIINLYTQLCQVEHCLYELKNKSTKHHLDDMDYLMNKLKKIKTTLSQNDLTRSEAHIFKKLWFRAYSIHGRKLVIDLIFGLFYC